MTIPKTTWAAIFPKPVAIESLGLSLGPATLCHLAALELLGCNLADSNFSVGAVLKATYILALPSAEVETLACSADATAAVQAAAAAWGASLPLSAIAPLREAVIRCINESFETALPTANPTAGAATAPGSAGPSKRSTP